MIAVTEQQLQAGSTRSQRREPGWRLLATRPQRGCGQTNDARAGSTVLVTAGGSGISRAMAEAFAAADARVWITDISQSALDSCPTEWQRDCHVRAIPARSNDLGRS